jgi:hypothetical protein
MQTSGAVDDHRKGLMSNDDSATRRVPQCLQQSCGKVVDSGFLTDLGVVCKIKIVSSSGASVGSLF